MMKKCAIILFLFLFVSSSTFAAGEQAGDFVPEAQTAVSADDQDSSSDPNRARRYFKRTTRNQSSPKSLPLVKRVHPRSAARAGQRPAAREAASVGWVSKAPVAPGLSKTSVYQKINVYRI
jgi:hypothetical protein